MNSMFRVAGRPASRRLSKGTSMTDPHDTRPERDRTVIVNNDRGGGGGSGWLIAGLLIVVILIGGYFLFGDRLTGGAGGGDTNVTIDAPDIDVPDVDVVPDAGNAAPAN
jgi:hypothetical protein